MTITQKQLDTLKKNNEYSRQLTREALEDALITLMDRQEYSSISVTDLAKKAGVSRAAFYRNFNSIDEILDDKIKGVAVKVSETIGADLYSNWLMIFNIIEENREAVRIFIRTGQEHKILDYLNCNLPLDINDRMLQAVWNAVIYNLIVQWLISGTPETPAEAARLACKYTKGIPPL